MRNKGGIGERERYLRVGRGGVEGPPRPPSSSSSLSEMDDAKATALSGSSP